MPTSVVLFNRVLRLHDHPALATAVRRSDRVVPLFVIDPAIVDGPFGSPNRLSFLRDTLTDLRRSLRARGGDLVLRRGDPAAVAVAVAVETGATTIHHSADAGRHALARTARLHREAAAAGIEVVAHPGIAVVDPGLVRPSGGGDHFKVFTPYSRAWSALARRPVAATPASVTLPDGLDPGDDPDRLIPASATAGASPRLPGGGETEGRRRLEAWQDSDLADYEAIHDDLAGDRTSRLSPYLHFGCLSALELTTRLSGRPGADAFIRQLCWRDFYHQVVATFPDIARRDYRPRGDAWLDDPDLLTAWTEGRTGYPIVDAGMRQLREEGWMHNRARMITASFLVKDLGIDWRVGAAHFLHWLCDGDIVQNSSNWQWTAGTGNDTRPNRVFNPLRQAERFDPAGAYVRRYVPELAGIAGGAVHQPWRLPVGQRPAGYPGPVVDHDAAAAAFLARRTGAGAAAG
jgi:deoxyribodipyrimidine photo-lyase